MAALPDRVAHLTPEQEEKLFELWRLVLHISGVANADSDSVEDAPDTPEDKTTPAAGDKAKKKRLGLFKRKDKKDAKEGVDSQENGAATPLDGSADDEGDKYGLQKQFREVLANRSPASIRESLWSMVKMDHPDHLVLRFLRARKWDVQKALVMLVATMKWRQDVHIDDDVMGNGEEWALLQEKDPSSPHKQLAQGFLAQLRNHKSFCRGIDRVGRPVTIVNVRQHRAGDQTEESIERFTMYLIETERLLLTPTVDTACIIFDMTGFTMANMDYAPLKFMIQCFEANYPESLGVVLVHKAPWVFQGIWKIIKGWLDPVVASKVRFTNNAKDISEFIEPGRILKQLDGEDDWSFKYIEPVVGENAKMEDTGVRDKLVAERNPLYGEYEQKTLQWLGTPDADKRSAIKADRDSIARKLREGYWALDPYVRARSIFDRQGVILPGGEIQYYPEKKGASAAGNSAASAPATVETSADDVD